MSAPVVAARDVSKQYRIIETQRQTTLRDAIAAAPGAVARSLRGLADPITRAQGGSSFWALRDVSFDIAQGEAIGLIGANGAGKSTLLKILSRITEPTSGEVRMRGRVGSLLEVGTGFHSELSGRENIFLSGAILGMRRHEIREKLDEIIAFSEVETFIDTPVKHYSSGMYLRLAFAVAAHLEPEILLVDEVLAVGDAQFQKKCLGKMGEVARHGRTVVLVSHNMGAVLSLCERVLWLDEGRLQIDGDAEEVVRGYLSAATEVATERSWDDPSTAPGNGAVRLRGARVARAEGRAGGPLTIRTPLRIEFEFDNLKAGAYLNLSVKLYDPHGVMAFNTASILEPDWHGQPFPEGRFRSGFIVPGDLLNDGLYRVELLIVRDQTIPILRVADVLVFEVQDEPVPGLAWYGKWPGAVRPALSWRTELLSGSALLDRAGLG